jgi:hypothetical protein
MSFLGEIKQPRKIRPFFLVLINDNTKSIIIAIVFPVPVGH